MLKLPYITGRQIKEWYDRHEIPISYKDAQLAAIKARQREKHILGEIHKPVRKQ